MSPLKPQGREGFWKLYDLVQLRRGGEATGSALETLLFAELRRAGIELPVLQHPVFVTDERPLCHVDFAWPRKKIALFADSGYHVGKRARLDAAQRLTLSKLGWTVVHVFEKMLEDRAWIGSFAELFSPEAGSVIVWIGIASRGGTNPLRRPPPNRPGRSASDAGTSAPTLNWPTCTPTLPHLDDRALRAWSPSRKQAQRVPSSRAPRGPPQTTQSFGTGW